MTEADDPEALKERRRKLEAERIGEHHEHWRGDEAELRWMLLVVFVIYPLSIGPAIWLCKNAGVSQSLLLIYVPIFILCDLFPPLTDCLVLYGSLFGLPA